MASSTNTAQVPQREPEVVETNAAPRPLPQPETKEPKFVIKMNGSVPC